MLTLQHFKLLCFDAKSPSLQLGDNASLWLVKTTQRPNCSFSWMDTLVSWATVAEKDRYFYHHGQTMLCVQSLHGHSKRRAVITLSPCSVGLFSYTVPVSWMERKEKTNSMNINPNENTQSLQMTSLDSVTKEDCRRWCVSQNIRLGQRAIKKEHCKVVVRPLWAS